MLLKYLYELAHLRNLLDDLAFASRPIRWVVAIDSDGNLIGSGPQETEGAKNRGKEFSAPQTSRNKSAGGVAEFLADGLTSVFGLDANPEKDKDNEKKRRERDANNAAKCEDFWQQIKQGGEATRHPALQAMLQFRAQTHSAPPFLRWGLSGEAKRDEKPVWWLTTAAGNEIKLGPESFTFEVNGQLPLNDEETLRPYWRLVYQREVAEKENDAKPGLCLITGAYNVPIARTHATKIKGVPNTQSFGAAIVSFDKPAFASYGFDQSHNAPASTEAATAYCVALNWLLSRRNHSLRIGPSAVCFWAKETEEATDFFAAMLDNPQPEQVRDFLTSPWAGIDRTLLQHDQFYSLTLAGNAGRIVVRHWMQSSVEAARENLRRWFADLEIAPYGDPAAREKRKKKDTAAGGNAREAPQPLALYSLAATTVRDAKDLQSETLTQLYRAALEGTAPSLLLKPILNRLEVDLVRDGPKALHTLSRFALLRLTLNRNRKEGEPMIEPQVFDTDDAAYNCGRLLAIFDDLQMRAHDYQLEGAGVVERYYGSASSAPNSAFGILWRLHQHHLKKVARQSDKGKAAAEAIKRRIADIACRFAQPQPNQPPSFPRTFNLQAQGRFALGFYQQKAASDAEKRVHSEKKQQSAATPTESDSIISTEKENNS